MTAVSDNSDPSFGVMETACRELSARISKLQQAGKPLLQMEREALDLAKAARARGRADLAVSLLAPHAKQQSRNPQLHFLLALARRDQQDLQNACRSIGTALSLAPADPTLSFAFAQFSFEAWKPAARLFRDAQKLAPDNIEITKNAAAALYAEGEGETAKKILVRALKAHPDWIEGRQHLSKYQILDGNRDNYDDCFKSGCADQPDNLQLRLAWFHQLSIGRDWSRALEVIEDGEKLLGEQRAFVIARAFIAAETRDDEQARCLLESLNGIEDAGLDLCKVRFFLRTGEPERAEPIAARHIGSPSIKSFWPYLSTCWRLVDDPRAEWLDRSGAFIKEVALPADAQFFEDLAALLRRLHKSKSPYLEQSVRGGTQTERNLFFNGDPVIQKIRGLVGGAVRRYVEELPQPEKTHPLLSLPRNQILFEGSWSVRLGAGGFHSVHTHTMGWISSALYVSLPKPAMLGAPPAGWISFGEPPPELALDLPAYREVEPAIGKLVLFPSTMWHGTKPFGGGERLTIAFDIAPPTY